MKTSTGSIVVTSPGTEGHEVTLQQASPGSPYVHIFVDGKQVTTSPCSMTKWNRVLWAIMHPVEMAASAEKKAGIKAQAKAINKAAKAMDALGLGDLFRKEVAARALDQALGNTTTYPSVLSTAPTAKAPVKRGLFSIL